MKRRQWLNLILVVGLVAALLPAAAAQAAPALQSQVDRGAQFVPGEVLVTFDEKLAPPAAQLRAGALAGQVGAQVAASYTDMALLSFAVDADVDALSAQLVNTGRVHTAQPNYIYWIPEDGSERALQPGTFSDPGYTVTIQPGRTRALNRSQLAGMRTTQRTGRRSRVTATLPNELTTGAAEDTWGWDRVNAEIIWQGALPSPAVCVIDTGVDAKHKDLAKRVINGYDFVNDDKLPADDNGHGTHVAGTVTALGNNGSTTAIGVSNGKVVAVKSLNAQGWGTSYSIAAGIRFCADRPEVRVINLSLGSGASDPIEYDALYYAIHDRGMTVVAAGGNTYSSDLSYPAAWGDPTVTAPGGGANQLHKGLISVGAARINPPTYPVWVDTNGNDTWEANESYEYNDCAVSFTNFGRHINLIAPGHWIYSTTPTSTPFFNQYYYGDRAGYEFYSGTSMAAPFVAGAAVRVLSLFPGLGNGTTAGETLKERLVNSGKELTYAVDPIMDKTGFDPAHPYDYKNGDYFNNGVAKPQPDANGVMAIKAPFCWPTSKPSGPGIPANPYTALQDMSSARYLNVAAAMRRFGVMAEVFDATTALPLKDAVVRVFRSDGLIMDSVKVTKSTATVLLLNLPIDASAEHPFYYLQVSKSGYTAGYQTYGYFAPDLDPNNPADKFCYGEVCMTPTSSVAAPSNKDISAVLNWLPYADTNLDLYLWLPSDSASPGYVSADWLPDYAPTATTAPDLGQGTLLPPSAFGGTVSPYAQLIHDGGREGFASDILPFDTVTIKTQPKVTLPWYTGTTDSYHLLVTDYSRSYQGANPEVSFPTENYLTWPTGESGNNNQDFAYPVLRVWKKGVLAWNNIIQMYWYEDKNGDNKDELYFGQNCDRLDIDWWHAADLNGAAVTPMHRCGDASGGALDVIP